jgi:hypothetical protein
MPVTEGWASPELACVLECDLRFERPVRYVLNVFAQALGLRLKMSTRGEITGRALLYTAESASGVNESAAVTLRHDPAAWGVHGSMAAVDATSEHGSDLLAVAFHFLSGQSERDRSGSRQLHRDSIFERRGVAADVVDRCLAAFRQQLVTAGVLPASEGQASSGLWADHGYAVALTHDVDYLPVGRWDNLKVAAKSAARHLLKQRSPGEAARGIAAYLGAVGRGDDPFGCVPAIIAEEQRRGVKSSFQVAVGHRHPFDVNYRIEDDRIRDYLAVIPEQGFDLCLHGSYRSTEQPGWYEEEVELLSKRLGRPLGSRQHFLSFDADALFAAQERAGIQYDMSMGFPDRCGSRVGFSHPYFPYNLAEERPYNVLQIPLVLMDVTLRSYMGLRGQAAWAEIQRQLDAVRQAGGAVSIVWHPIVFGGARDPGFDRLYWRLVEYVQETGGLATDGRTINALARERASRYGFPGLTGPGAS